MAVRSFNRKLMSGAAIPVILTAGIAVGSGLIFVAPGHAVTTATQVTNALPAAKTRPQGIQLAACNPCNPCAAANPCNPCNPCGAAAATASDKCFVPRLRVAAAANPCNPCAAKNPCAAANPCAAKNPCNPCGAATAVEISPAEAKAAYDCLVGEMTTAYEKAGMGGVAGYTGWTNVATAPYTSATHGSRYVNNYVNRNGAFRYARFEEGGLMPVGTVIAKDSFVANPDGSVAVGPLFIMEKAESGFNPASGNWRYSMIMPNGSVAGITNGAGSTTVEFCNECHAAMEDQDYLFFLPEEFRVNG